ncbi:hypothetical protein JS44_16460 [Anoxybacillus flavithermus]|uniref:Uncharacterized protein n=1 Tax=Anoxybacillus flavithermus TaxID=33934 RepID=A0A094LB74_9BACL|nr:hypothetical protein JS44_16460 [Anoxybacillus flavithermus]
MPKGNIYTGSLHHNKGRINKLLQYLLYVQIFLDINANDDLKFFNFNETKFLIMNVVIKQLGRINSCFSFQNHL